MLRLQTTILMTLFSLATVDLLLQDSHQNTLGDHVQRQGRQEPVHEIQWLEDAFGECEDDPETGLCCMIKDMSYNTIEKDPILECNHTTIEKCHYTYVTIYDSINETVCKENYEKVCQLTTVKQPINETVIRCHKPLIKTCEKDDPGVEQICQTVYESACSTKYKDIPNNGSLECPDNCTDATQGLCDTSTGTCQCTDGFAGENCADRVRFHHKGLLDVEKGKLVTAFPTWSTEYQIEFDIIVTDNAGMTDNYINVFHVSNISSNDGDGSKIPGAWLNKDFFRFCCGNNDCVTLNGAKDKYKLNTLYHFKITQELEGEKVMFKARHVDSQLYFTENPSPKEYENVKLYVSDPWSDSFASHGTISNLEITDLSLYTLAVVSEAEVRARMCVLDTDNDDELSYDEYADKVNQFYTLMETAYHNEQTAELKDGFDLIDLDGNNALSFEEFMKFFKDSSSRRRQGVPVQDRWTNALAESKVTTEVKIKAVLDLIFCACDTDGDNRISQEEKDKEQCVAIQKSVFHGNYIDQGGFDFLRSVNNDADDSEITLQEAGVALTNIINTSQEYYEFFTGESNKNGRFLTTKRRQAMSDLADKSRKKRDSSRNEDNHSHRQARWMGNTTCEQIPIEICGAGCKVEEGPELCHEKIVYSFVDVPMEMCDINPRTICHFQTKLVPKLIPEEKCTNIPREKCALNFKPKTVQKPLQTKWCRPKYPGDK